MKLFKNKTREYASIPLITVIHKKRKEWLEDFFDRIDFRIAFVVWITVITIFGIFYIITSSDSSYLVSAHGKVVDIFDHIYFSFMTATSTGLGDITPIGKHRLLAVFEVMVGMTLFAVVTSKLVSIKQEAILKEIYDISFSEKVNRLKSSLYLFRVNANRIISKIEEGSIKKREIADIWILFSSLETTLEEISPLMTVKKQKRQYMISINSLQKELLLNSINMSLEKIDDLIYHLNANNIDWKRDITIRTIESILQICERIISLNKGEDKKIADKAESLKSVVSVIRKLITPEEKG